MLTIIVCDDHIKRLKIHQYLDGKENKVSMYSNLFDAEKTGAFFVKSPCTRKWKYLHRKDAIFHPYGEPYLDGYYSYWFNCPCGGFSYDPNCDLFDRKEIYKNNIIVYGSYLKGYTSPNHSVKNSEVSENEYNILISELKIFTIPNPERKLNKKELEVYINEQLKSIN